MFAVVWFGTPHSPFKALDEDKIPFGNLKADSENHYGELVAMDRSIGTLRSALREMKIADETLFVFCSDNGGLPRIQPDTVGGLRGHKGSVYEGGLRVPAIIEWPSMIQPRISSYPACTMDLFPTVADILGLPEDVFVKPLDGVSLKPLLSDDIGPREQPIGFRFQKQAAWVDNDWKLVTTNRTKGDKFELYNLNDDPHEENDLAAENPMQFEKLKTAYQQWDAAVDASYKGKDYAAGKLTEPDPDPHFWFVDPRYQEYLPEWKERWEYRSYIERVMKKR